MIAFRRRINGSVALCDPLDAQAPPLAACARWPTDKERRKAEYWLRVRREQVPLFSAP